jgi:phosphatidate phosphatase PAH1
MKQTGSIKTNMMMMIRSLFPSNREPFCGGLGNRENDAIAYLAAGIKKSHVFIIDKQSEVHKLSQPNKPITYSQIHKEI